MAKIKSALEKALEKAEELGNLTDEEKEKLKQEEELKSMLSEFYKGRIDRDSLWQRLKGREPAFLKEVQMNLADSIGLGSASEEFHKRKDGILAVETLKDSRKVPEIEDILADIESLRNEYQEGKDKVAEELREAVEKNPQLRMKPVRTPDGKTMYQAAVSVDEAVQARISEFLAQHEETFGAEFSRMIVNLKWALSE